MRHSGWIKGAIIALLVALALGTLFVDFASVTVTGLPLGGQSLGGLGSMMGLMGGALPGGGLAGDALSALDSGGLTLLEVRSLLPQVSQLAATFSGLGVSVPVPSPGVISAATVALIAVLVLAFLTAALSIWAGFTGRRFLGIPFAAVMILTLVGELVGQSLVNDHLGSLGSLALTAGPVAGAILATVSAVVAIVLNRGGLSAPVKAVRGFKVSSRRVAGGWVCPRCGAKVGAGDRFCASCGTPKPEPRRCPKCAAECGENEAFCARCGFRLPSAAPRSAQQAQPVQPMNPAQQPARPMSFAQQAQPAQPINPVQQPARQAQPAPSFAPGAASSPWPARPGEDGTVNPNAFEPEIFRDQQARTTRGTLRMTADGAAVGLEMVITVEQPRTGFRQEYPVTLVDRLTIGRSQRCDITVDDNAVSGRHLLIERSGDVVFVTDTNSSNGTRLNGSPLLGRAALTSGDRLAIGYTRVIVKW